MHRLTLSLALVILLAVVSLGGLLDNFFNQYQSQSNKTAHELSAYHQLGKSLAATLDKQEDPHQFIIDWQQESHLTVTLLALDDFFLPDSLKASFYAKEPLNFESADNISIHFIIPTQEKVLVFTIPLITQEGHDDILQLVLTMLFYLGILMVILIWVSPLIKQLKRLKQITQAFGEGQLQQRINVKSASYIASIENEFNCMAQRISGLLAREKNFTRDVSHELRTPITLLKNTLALRADSPFTKNDRAILTQVSEDLEKTVEVLLALARDENLIFSQTPMLPIVEHSVLTLYKANLNVKFDVALSLDPQFTVVGNPYLILLLCQNLVNNAYYHSGNGGMSIYNEGSTIIFENNIGGNERPNYQGLGHGQYLVERIANNMHWALRFEQKNTRYIVEICTAKAQDRL
ncbi:MAG: histidine kinase dimerization/phospho-acceptor domain-containing protein [Glaciecola sp.]